MNHRVSRIKNIRTIKALRGDTLTIDLGVTYEGTLTAWMKKKPNDATYRSFDIVDNRYLVLSNIKTSDYYFNDELVEAVEGKWFFDVELADASNPSVTKTIYTGKILFYNDITNSQGVELIPNLENGLLKIESFTATSGQLTYTVEEGAIVDNGFNEVIVNGQQWNSRTGEISFPDGNVSLSFEDGVITFHAPLEQGDQVVIKYS